MQYALILSSQGQDFCVQKTAHYPLVAQTSILVEKHAVIVWRYVPTQSEQGTATLSVSTDAAFNRNISVWPRARDMLAEMREVEMRPKMDIVIEGELA